MKTNNSCIIIKVETNDYSEKWQVSFRDVY